MIMTLEIMNWSINHLIITRCHQDISNSIPTVLFLSETHHFEHFALKSFKTIEQIR